MKSSKYINKIALTNIRKKKQRTYLSLIAISLSTAIIFTSATLFINIFTFSKNTDYENIGNYHYSATVDENTILEPSSRLQYTVDYDLGLLEVIDQNTINLRSLEVQTESQTLLPFVLSEGRLPGDSHEILVPEGMLSINGSTIKTNDQVSFAFNEFSYLDKTDLLYKQPDLNTLSENQTELSYKVCGTYLYNDVLKENIGGILPVYTTQASSENSAVVYVKDTQVQLSDSYTYSIKKLNLNEASVLSNTDVITNDSISNFLKDTTVLLVIFVIIAIIAITMSLISVHNVVLISDKDRKKELGLLKSIGATPNEVKKLLNIELILIGLLGAVLGVIMGVAISFFVLNLFIEKIHVVMHLAMVLNPVIIVISLIAGTLLMYFSGMKAYKKYINSSAISDLKNSAYEYAEPVKTKSRRRSSFEWRMFLIYNGRMKKQSKNIFYSFVLLLFTTILFTTIFLSNMIFSRTYKQQNYDFEISNYHSGTIAESGIRPIGEEASLEIYHLIDEGKINATNVHTLRLNQSTVTYWTPKALYDSSLLDSYTATNAYGMKTIDDENKTPYCNVYHYSTAFDKVQLEEIKPYVIAGSIDHLEPTQLIAIYTEKRLGAQMIDTSKLLGQVVYTTCDENTKIFSGINTIGAVAVIPESAYENKHFDFNTYPRVLASTVENAIASGNELNYNERIFITLKNTSTASQVLDSIEEKLKDVELFENYQINALAITVETNRFASFIIEALLYPLFFMLFIVSLLNINNVFIGNVHLKRNDVSIMKSVGMSGSQLNTLFIFEYVEGYLNAAFVATIIFIPAAIIEGKLGIASSFDFGSNIVGTLLVSLFILGIILVAPLIYFSLKTISNILPIENLKDAE